MIDTDIYEGHTEGDWNWTKLGTHTGILLDKHGKDIVQLMMPYDLYSNPTDATVLLIADAPKLLAEVKRLSGLLDEIDDVVYYNDKKAGQVLPVEKPNLELLRDIMMSYADEACQIRGDEGGWIE